MLRYVLHTLSRMQSKIRRRNLPTLSKIRYLPNDKGIQATIDFKGKDSVILSYKNRRGVVKNVVIERGEYRGDKAYVHIDDEQNEVLILTSQPFLY